MTDTTPGSRRQALHRVSSFISFMLTVVQALQEPRNERPFAKERSLRGEGWILKTYLQVDLCLLRCGGSSLAGATSGTQMRADACQGPLDSGQWGPEFLLGAKLVCLGAADENELVYGRVPSGIHESAEEQWPDPWTRLSGKLTCCEVACPGRRGTVTGSNSRSGRILWNFDMSRVRRGRSHGADGAECLDSLPVCESRPNRPGLCFLETSRRGCRRTRSRNKVCGL